MTGERVDGAGEHPDFWSEETAEEACRTLVFLLYSRREQWDRRSGPSDSRGHLKRNLLIADYARKSQGLSAERKSVLDRLVVDSFLPGNPSLPWQGVPPPTAHPASADVGVVVVIREELDALLKVFGLDDGDFEVSDDGQRFYTAVIPNRYLPNRPLSVVVTAAGVAGQVQVGGPTRALVDRYAPHTVFLLGTAAGVWAKVELGDVVVSDCVLYYEPGRLGESGVWQPRPERERSRDRYGCGFFYYDCHRLEFRANVREFLSGLPDHRCPKEVGPGHVPEVHSAHATIASGEIVLRDGTSLQDLRDRYDETIRAADMESYGFVRAVGNRRWLIFRGISDYGDDRQWPEWQFLSSAFAALCLKDFLQAGYLPPGSDGL